MCGVVEITTTIILELAAKPMIFLGGGAGWLGSVQPEKEINLFSPFEYIKASVQFFIYFIFQHLTNRSVQ